MELEVTPRLSALAHPQRLALFRLLMRRYPDRVPATELAQALGVKANTLSTYIGSLKQAGLVTQERAGTSLRYAISMEATRHMFDYLLLDCCRGRPEICAPIAESHAANGAAFKVLFICTGNSARSIFAEAILRDLAPERFDVFSAGTQARSELNPFALEILEKNGHDISRLFAKNIEAMKGPDAPDFDFVFTVCDQAANEECPAWDGQPITAHWGLPDPVKATGTDAEKSLAFQHAYGALHRRMSAFAALPLGALDRLSLQHALYDIGQT